MITRSITVSKNPAIERLGAARFVDCANRYSSSVLLMDGNYKINAKSLLGVIAMELGGGKTISLVADGADELESLDALCALL